MAIACLGGASVKIYPPVFALHRDRIDGTATATESRDPVRAQTRDNRPGANGPYCVATCSRERSCVTYPEGAKALSPASLSRGGASGKRVPREDPGNEWPAQRRDILPQGGGGKVVVSCTRGGAKALSPASLSRGGASGKCVPREDAGNEWPAQTRDFLPQGRVGKVVVSCTRRAQRRYRQRHSVEAEPRGRRSERGPGERANPEL
jgi:hypothetical protein